MLELGAHHLGSANRAAERGVVDDRPDPGRVFAVNSVQADPSRPTVLLPSGPEDIVVRQRHYYNRYLTKRLANPLWDAKQLVLFRNIPVSDSRMLAQALAGVQESFSKHNLARVYAALAHGRE